MAAPTRTATERCYFLEIPPEIRIIIYKYITTFRRKDHRHSRVPYNPVCSNGSLEKLPITKVNRTVRQESAPIIYRSINYFIEVLPGVGDLAVFEWLEVQDPIAVENVHKFTLEPCHRCYYGFQVDLADLEDPVKPVSEHVLSECRRIFHSEFKAMVERHLMRLEVVGGKRKRMTKEAMRQLLKDAIRMV